MTQTSGLLPKTRAIHRSLKNCDKLAIRNSKRSAVGEVTKRWLTDTGLEVKWLRWCHHGALSIVMVHCHDAMSIVNWLGCLGGARMVPTHCLPIAAAPPQQRFTGLCAEDKTRRERRRVGKLCKLPLSRALPLRLDLGLVENDTRRISARA